VVPRAKNRSKFLKPDLSGCELVREVWNPRKSVGENFRLLGAVAVPPNVEGSEHDGDRQDLGQGALSSRPQLDVDVPVSEQLRSDVDRNSRRRPMSEEDQKYAAGLLSKYGENFHAMVLDSDPKGPNWQQLSEGKCSALVRRFKALNDKQRLVPIPPH
jgi:hypothetical protein